MTENGVFNALITINLCAISLLITYIVARSIFYKEKNDDLLIDISFNKRKIRDILQKNKRVKISVNGKTKETLSIEEIDYKIEKLIEKSDYFSEISPPQDISKNDMDEYFIEVAEGLIVNLESFLYLTQEEKEKLKKEDLIKIKNNSRDLIYTYENSQSLSLPSIRKYIKESAEKK